MELPPPPANSQVEKTPTGSVMSVVIVAVITCDDEPDGKLRLADEIRIASSVLLRSASSPVHAMVESTSPEEAVPAANPSSARAGQKPRWIRTRPSRETTTVRIAAPLVI